MLQDTVLVGDANQHVCFCVSCGSCVTTAFCTGCACFHTLPVLFLFSQIRMQAQGNVIQGSMMVNFINIYQEEGTRGLWKVQRARKVH